MAAAPSILLVDDGELDRVQALVQRLGLKWERCLEPDCDFVLERPRDLLVTSGPRAMRMPELRGEDEPVWVCIYDQDFLPLRDRLRELGVHYLVSGELDPRAFELFLHQLLHGGAERRAERRIPLRAEFELEVGFEHRKAVMIELSRESCVFVTAEEVPAERRVVVRLPAPLTGHEDFDLPGRVVRAASSPDLAGEGGVTTVVRFHELDAEAMARIHDVMVGNAPGTMVTPLSPEPAELAGDAWDGPEILHGAHLADDDLAEGAERRAAARHPLAGRAEAIRWPGRSTPQPALVRDLSASGVRIAVSPLPELGTELLLAVYAGAAREEPLLVEARVVRAEAGEAALAFGELTADQRHRLDRFLGSRPVLERLGAGPGPVHVAELLTR